MGIFKSPKHDRYRESDNTSLTYERNFKFRQDTDLNDTESKMVYTPLDKSLVDLKESDMLKDKHVYIVTDSSDQ